MNYLYIIVTIFVFTMELKGFQKVSTIGIPKSGNHLLSKIINLFYDNKFNVDKMDAAAVLGNNKNLNKTVLNTHLAYTHENVKLLRNNNYKIIVIYRDPRDVIVSGAFFIKERDYRWPELANFSISELILMQIQNYNKFFPRSNNHQISKLFKNIDTTYRKAYLPWIKAKNVYSTTFEKLIGKKGGGNDAAQMAELIKIAKYLGLKKSYSKLKTIASNAFGNSTTFKNGMIGTWKQYFTSQHKKEFKKIAGQLLIDLGYEKDFNW